MNQTFSLARFARLNRWFWATKSRTYLIAALALLPIISMLPLQVLGDSYRMMLVSAQRNDAGFLLVLSLFVTVCLGSDVFSALYKQESAVSYLMLPASRSEKFWLGVLYCVVALLLLSLVFFGIEAIFFNMANSRLPASETRRYESSLVLYLTSTGRFLAALFSVTAVMAITLLSSLFFRRGVLVRTAGILLVIVFGLTLLYGWIVSTQPLHNVGPALPFSTVTIYISKNHLEEVAPPRWLMYGAYAATLLMLWVIARIRFNEIER
jgi:hypothetical protein